MAQITVTMSQLKTQAEQLESLNEQFKSQVAELEALEQQLGTYVQALLANADKYSQAEIASYNLAAERTYR